MTFDRKKFFERNMNVEKFNSSEEYALSVMYYLVISLDVNLLKSLLKNDKTRRTCQTYLNFYKMNILRNSILCRNLDMIKILCSRFFEFEEYIYSNVKTIDFAKKHYPECVKLLEPPEEIDLSHIEEYKIDSNREEEFIPPPSKLKRCDNNSSVCVRDRFLIENSLDLVDEYKTFHLSMNPREEFYRLTKDLKV